MAIWGSDANGQLGRAEEEPEQCRKIIGPYTRTKHQKRKWSKTSDATHQTPNDTNEHMETTSANKNEKLEIIRSAGPEHTKQEIEGNGLITCKSPDRETARQIDYMAINRK